MSAIDDTRVPDCSYLTERTASPRWLTIPNSRLVVNPCDVTQLPAYPMPIEFAGSLPTHLGYYIGESPARLPFVWAWKTPRELIDGPVVDLTSWTPEGGISIAQSKLTMTEGNYGCITGQLTVDLDKTPYIALDVSTSEGTCWAAKVNSGIEAEDICIVRDTPRSGSFVLDLIGVTGWSGTKTFTLKLYAVGQPGASAHYANVRLAGSDGLAVREMIWSPHRIVTDAGSVRTTISIPDEHSVAQLLEVIDPGQGTLVLMGQTPDGDPAWVEDRRSIVLQCGQFRAAISLSRQPKWLGVSDSGTWAVAFDGLQAGDDIVVSTRFTPCAECVEDTVSEAALIADIDTFRKALSDRETDWDRRLAQVPHPIDFDLHLLKRDVTADDLRRMYYKAWVFLISDTLPLMPENDYGYPQIACGKPSLWAEGHEKAAPSCQWESFIAAQMMAWVDPEVAWASFEGMMSLVDEQGTLGGEGLPSRHVQTAWVLYALTGDSERLREIYPAMRRLLMWKASDPRWIYKGLTPSGFKDSEFVVHALMDMLFMKRVCDVLDMPDERSFWQVQMDDLKEKYRCWFWDEPGGTPYFTYSDETGRRSGDRESWCFQGLVLPPEVMGPPEMESILRTCRSYFDDAVPFLISNLNKHPTYNFTMIGMWRYGTPLEVARMTEAAMSAVTLAGEFGECYADVLPGNCWGVQPSIFGAANVIDAALWHNGIVIGEGLPVIAHVPNAVGVDGLMLPGGPIGVRFEGDDVEIRGGGLNGLPVPSGFTESRLADGIPCWRGRLPVGEQINLGDG